MRKPSKKTWRSVIVLGWAAMLASASFYAWAQEEIAPMEQPDNGWPRKTTTDGVTVTTYQPQMETWDKNRLTARAAVSFENPATPTPVFGVAWLEARTEVDKENRMVTLDEVKITKVNFPSQPDKAAAYQAILEKTLPTESKTIALDRLQANLAVTQAEAATKKLPL